MMINKRECLLCNPDDFEALIDTLGRSGYMLVSGNPLDELLSLDGEHKPGYGVRWCPDEAFPDCLYGVTAEQREDLLDNSQILEEHGIDNDVLYCVKRWAPNDPSIIEVGDLL